MCSMASSIREYVAPGGRTMAQLEQNRLVVSPTVRLGGWLPSWLTKLAKTPLGAFGIAVLVVVVVMALAAPVLAPYGPAQVGTGLPMHGPTAAHWLGTDQLGRDLLSRLIYGSRVSLVVGFI